jgi:hypothetical protein
MNTKHHSKPRWTLAAAALALLAMTASSSAQSNNADLSNLTSTPAVTFTPTFDSGTIAYTANVPYATTSMTVTPTKADALATITVNGIPVASGTPSGSISLAVGNTVITTVVTAEDTFTTKTYTLTVTRADADTNADLASLTTTPAITFTPTFDSGTITYTANVPYATTGMTVTPTRAGVGATITVNGNTVASGSPSGSISLGLGDTTITTVVTAEDAFTTKTYTLIVTRGAASTNADLASLTTTPATTLTPAFDSAITSYTTSVAYPTPTMTVTPTKADALATIKVNGNTVASGNASAPISLNPGANIITTVVTAEDTSTKTYTLTVTVTVADPVAIPGGPYTVAIPTGSLSLNGSASLPSDGQTITNYDWDLDNDGDYDEAISGATPAAIDYATLTAAPPTGYGMVFGANTINLRVTDDSSPTPKTSTVAATVNLVIPTTTFNGTTNTDWNTATNWDSGLPTGSIYMVIAAGKSANNASATPATSTGKLTLNSGSKITVPNNAAAGENTVVTTPSSIEFNGGTLDLSSQDTISFPALTMTGTGKLTASSNSGDSRTRNINNAISGSGQFTIEGRNRQVWNFGTNNPSFSGGLLLNAIDRYEVKFNVAGAAGTGNVTVNPRSSPADNRSAILVLGANNVFADTATLTLNGKGWAGSTGGTYPGSNAAIDMKTFSDTIDKLFVAGVQMPAGTYTGGSGTWIIGTGILTVLTSPPDTTPPTLAGSGFVDNKSGGPITAFEKVTYTVTFSEPMKASTIGTDDFENAVSPAATINSVTATGNPAVYTVSVTPGGTGTLQLQVKVGAVLEDLAGNPLVTTSAIPDDTTITVNPDPPPSFVSITDNKAGGPVLANEALTYFVTFNQPMNPATVDTADFENGAAPAITVTQVVPTGYPTIFAVDVVPGGAGTITLQIKAGAVITNANGTALDTTSALPDDTTITVNAGSVPARSTITVNGTTSWNGLSGTLNASGSSKLVVIVTGETGNPGDLTGNSTAVTYDGAALTKVVDRNPIGGNPFDQTFNDIWYLDNPSTSTGAIIATVVGGCNVTAFALSGTAPGVGATSISPQASKSVVLPTSFANSIVIASHGMGGNDNTADTGNVDAVAPLTETSALFSGSNWHGHVTGYALVPAVGTAVYSFIGGNLVGSHTIAAEFLAAVPTPSSPYGTWATANAPTGNPDDDYDGDGVPNAVEFVLGGLATANDLGKLPAAATSGGNMTFTFVRDQDSVHASVSVVIEVGINLATWPDLYTVGADTAGSSAGVTVTDNLDGTDTITLTVVQAPDTKKFARMQVVVTAP